MFNGGVSFEGDEALARAALPEALRLANVVRSLKTSLGLDRLEKTYDIENNGTVRVVDLEHVRHLYITVPPQKNVIEEDERVQADVEALLTSTFAVFPPFGPDTFPSPPAPSPNAVAITWQQADGAVLTANEDFLATVYSYEPDAFARRRNNINELDWYSETGIRFHVEAEEPTTFGARRLPISKYSLISVLRSDRSIYTRDGRLLTASDEILGIGLLNNWLLWVTGVATTIVWAQKVSINEDIQSVAVLGSPQQLGFFASSYNDIVPTIPNILSTIDCGTLWFSFSPDGTKAARCRAYIISSGEAPLSSSEVQINNGAGTFPIVAESFCEQYSFLEELRFTFIDEDTPPSFSRTISDNTGGSTVSTIYERKETVRDIVADSPDFVPPDWTTGEPVPSTNLETVSGTRTRHVEFTASQTVNTTMVCTPQPFIIAYDYAADNTLVSLEIDYKVLEGSNIQTSEYYVKNYEQQTRSGTQPAFAFGSIYYHEYSNTFNRLRDEASNQDWVTTDKVCIQADLVYRAYGKEHRVLNYIDTEWDLTFSKHRYYEELNSPSTATYSGRFLGGLGDYTQEESSGTLVGEKGRYITCNGAIEMRGAQEFLNNSTSLVGTDLRNGLLLCSFFPSREVFTASKATSGVEGGRNVSSTSFYLDEFGAPGIIRESTSTGGLTGTEDEWWDQQGDHHFFPMRSQLTVTRTDILYHCAPDGSTTEHVLPPVSSLNISGTPSYSYTHDLEIEDVHWGLGNPIDEDARGRPSIYGALRARSIFVRAYDYVHTAMGLLSKGFTVSGGLGDASGSLATIPGVTSLMAVNSVDLREAVDPVSAMWDQNVSGFGAFPQCRQATYVFSFGEGVATPITGLLWDSVEIYNRGYSSQASGTRGPEYGQIGNIDAVYTRNVDN